MIFNFDKEDQRSPARSDDGKSGGDCDDHDAVTEGSPLSCFGDCDDGDDGTRLKWHLIEKPKENRRCLLR